MKLKLRAGNLCKNAISEFEIAGWIDQENNYRDDVQGEICECVLDLLEILDNRGSYGVVTPFGTDVPGLFKNLANFGVIKPLIGDDDEWMPTGNGSYQNKRFGQVHKNSIGQAFFINGRIFESFSGARFTSVHSRLPINFPWSPIEPEVIKMVIDENGDEAYPSDMPIYYFYKVGNVPELGSLWKRKDSDGSFTYQVKSITNLMHQSQKHEPAVVYYGDNGSIWSMPIKQWPGNLVEVDKADVFAGDAQDEENETFIERCDRINCSVNGCD